MIALYIVLAVAAALLMVGWGWWWYRIGWGDGFVDALWWPK